jgi:enoyl-CoA hydratase
MPFAPTEHLLMEQDGPVMVLTLNNPDMKNAFLDDMHQAMQEVWQHLAADTSVRSAVLTGAGTAFSAGGNIPGFIRDYEDPEHRRNSLRMAERLMYAMAEFPKPLVTAVNGPAVGLGCSVATGGDIVYIADDTFMADTHVSIGLVAGDGGAALWPLLMGLLKAKEYLLTGDRIPAAMCVELGLANHAVPKDDLMPRALEMAHRLAEQPPQAVQGTKAAINLHVRNALTLVAPLALAAESESFTTDDIRRTIERFKKRA